MEITLKGIDFVDQFASDLYNRLHGELKDLPGIISQMGIRGEQVSIVFHGVEYGKDSFTVSVDDPQNPKVFECTMRTGSMINPYYGFSCSDGKTTKEFSWNEEEKKLEILCEYSLTGEDKGGRVIGSEFDCLADDYSPGDIAP